MGFTPTGGIPMSTRSGDLDPDVVLYLLREKGFAPPELGKLVNEKSGLLGLSGISSDMQDLLAVEHNNPAAAEAIAVFCYQVGKYIGGFTAALGGMDTLVFAGGIGENAAPIRRRICAGLAFLGVLLDDAANARHADVISAPESKVKVRVIRTNEELMVAKHSRDVLAAESK
jgi:acetate kinase